MIIAATGHRPEKLGGYTNHVRLALGGLATEYLSGAAPTKVISGMALGWDQAVTAAALALGIPVTAAIPFEGQESRWPPEAQARYRRLLAACSDVVVVSEIASVRAMQLRNEWMVDHAHKMVALWDGSFGGTHNCIVYARKWGRPIDNLWSRWSMDADLRDLLGL